MTHTILLSIVLAAQMGCDPVTSNDDLPTIQRKGIANAVVSLEGQIRELATLSDRTPVLKDSLPVDQQEAVTQLGDSMSENTLLTKTYLALGVAELKRVTIENCAPCLSLEEKRKHLRHAEAIQYAIDDRLLESQDLRVYKVFQAGVSQALRVELEKLQSQPQSAQYVMCGRRRTRIAVLARCSNCR